MINWSVSTQGTFDQLLCFVDSVRYLCTDQRLAIKSCHCDILVGCNDDTVTGSDFFRCQYVLGTTRSVCFYLDGNSHFFRFLFQTFRRHVSMGDTGRACGNCEDLIRFCRCIRRSFCFFFCFFREFFFLGCINISKKFINILCMKQLVSEILIHQKHGQTTEYFQMYIVLCIRCCDQENKICRFSVQRIVIYTLRKYHGCKSRCAYRFSLAMRDCNAFTNSCSSFFFSFEDGFTIGVNVIDVPAFCHQIDHFTDDLLFGVCLAIEANTLLFE